jgi:hypothetical protein
MAKIPLPDRGQPLDVTYLYQMSNAINDLANDISSATYQYTSVYTRDAGKQDIKTAQSRIVAGYKDITNNETVAANTTRSWFFDYPNDFKYPPISTATVVNRGTNDIGNDVTVVITANTTSRIEGVIKFNKAGSVTTSINIIAIGIPT